MENSLKFEIKFWVARSEHQRCGEKTLSFVTPVLYYNRRWIVTSQVKQGSLVKQCFGKYLSTLHNILPSVREVIFSLLLWCLWFYLSSMSLFTCYKKICRLSLTSHFHLATFTSPATKTILIYHNFPLFVTEFWSQVVKATAAKHINNTSTKATNNCPIIISTTGSCCTTSKTIGNQWHKTGSIVCRRQSLIRYMWNMWRLH